MQIPRHWRMQRQRYQLTGTLYANGEVSLLDRPNPPSYNLQSETNTSIPLLEVIKPVPVLETISLNGNGSKERVG